ncbi:MAG: hypothetical protein EOM20_10075 [Spartobacteria bacterium]|nr:hypothetical protein [Spartobacteria bacterium]
MTQKVAGFLYTLWRTLCYRLAMKQKLNVVVVDWSWFCPAVMAAMRATGRRVTAVPRSGEDLARRVREACSQHQADCIFSINFNPLLAEVSHALNLPYLAWNVDNLVRSDFCEPRFASPSVWLFLIDKPSLNVYRQKGYPHVHYLPIASDLETFRPAPGTPARYDVSFVGCSMIREGNEFPGVMRDLKNRVDGAETPLDKRMYLLVDQVLRRMVEEECRDFFHPTLRERLDEAAQALGFDLAAVLWPDPAFFHIVLAKEISSRKRVKLLTALARRQPVDVFGDPEWAALGAPGLTCHPRADYPAQTARVYQQSRITLNIEKVYNTASLNLRIIDAMACGSFVLTEPVDDLADFFRDGVDLALFSSARELEEKTAYYLAHPDERERIAAHGQQTVSRHFSLRQRVDEMFRHLNDTHTCAGEGMA